MWQPPLRKLRQEKFRAQIVCSFSWNDLVVDCFQKSLPTGNPKQCNSAGYAPEQDNDGKNNVVIEIDFGVIIRFSAVPRLENPDDWEQPDCQTYYRDQVAKNF